MTFIPITTAATAGAAAAAAAQRREQQREEEQMTRYKSDDLDGWEFKIVRAGSRRFRDPEAVRRVRDEESKAGWEMLEKFDDQRIRFKRRVDQRSMDAHLDVDPYRTRVGMPANIRELTIVGSVILTGGLIALILFLAYGVLQ